MPNLLDEGTAESKTLTVDDISRLLKLIMAVADEEECTYSEAIQRLSERNEPAQPIQTDRAAVAEFMGRTRRVRMKRNHLLGAPIFRDPPFDMLLELFATHQRGEEISVTSLCYASGVPATTALRHLAQLEKYGLIVRQGDLSDNRRCLVLPTPRAIAGLEAMFDHWHAEWTRLIIQMAGGPTTAPEPKNSQAGDAPDLLLPEPRRGSA
jgi:hypothetical protein